LSDTETDNEVSRGLSYFYPDPNEPNVHRSNSLPRQYRDPSERQNNTFDVTAHGFAHDSQNTILIRPRRIIEPFPDTNQFLTDIRVDNTDYNPQPRTSTPRAINQRQFDEDDIPDGLEGQQQSFFEDSELRFRHIIIRFVIRIENSITQHPR